MRQQTTFAVAAAVALGLTVAGCGVTVGFGQQQATRSYDVTDGVTSIETRTGSGEIEVNESERTGIHVTETLHWRGDQPRDGHAVEGDRLRMEYRCDACSVDYRIDIPRGLGVKVDSGSGTITLRALTGAVNASTGSGDIDGGGLRGRSVTASTGSGQIELRFAAPPDRVEVKSGSGDGVVRLPQGAYNVTAETGSGTRTVNVAQDSAAPRTVVVKTGSGDAKVLAS
ncbi:DUF4097 family beta strand repeat protein [Microbispora sp. RL4-1S]|uniref:DUF4097 family beta strand repeat protein n=1 Tax=Microbispora oryzae TaxID=2806554 RepID=A0A940WEK0_9ACTN|nr:DUF4097 family beta strand repeat-containing protein [Microbispora oryzae]MBP2702707.1 DUF4097 family beta strand repeat protein [Microbispora oryzae]